MRTLKRLFALSFFALLGSIVGYWGSALFPATSDSPEKKELPLPHQVSKRPDGLSLRFAMVHDVLLERYPRHSREWYRQRNTNVRKKLSRLKKKHPSGALPQKAYTLYDDLGVGLARVERFEEAVNVLREKRKRQKQQGITGKPLYSTYANLGTVLVHAHLKDAVANQVDAREAVQTGLSHIRKSMDINPDAHFGREKWQAVAVAFLLASIDQPELLKKYDMVGNHLNESVGLDGRSAMKNKALYIRKYSRDPVEELLNLNGMENRNRLRSHIQHIVPDDKWRKATGVDLPEQGVPFDEPVLAIIGMWRIGGGPNPHFAIALGEMMLRVGQRRLAWEAYERARRMKQQLPADHNIRKQLVEHCRFRQDIIEQSLPDSREELVSSFVSELQYARNWRYRYQAFEEKRLKEGVKLTNDHFHEPFFEKHGSIATEPGKADYLRVNAPGPGYLRILWPMFVALFGAGLFSFLYGLSVYRSA